MDILADSAEDGVCLIHEDRDLGETSQHALEPLHDLFSPAEPLAAEVLEDEYGHAELCSESFEDEGLASADGTGDCHSAECALARHEHARNHDLLEERDKAKGRQASIDQDLSRERQRLIETMNDAWRTLLAGPVRSARRAAQGRAEEAIQIEIGHLRMRALHEDQCPTCDRMLDALTRERLKEWAGKYKAQDAEAVSIREALTALAELERVDTPNMTPLVSQIEERIDDIRVELGALRDRLQDLDLQLADSDPDVLRERRRTHGDVIRKIDATERGIVAERTEVEKKAELIRALQRQLEVRPDAALRAAQQQMETCRSLLALFDAGISAYRDELRKKVEATASDLFMSMTTEKDDFRGLTINESYGLTIRHRDGTPVEARSAGAEHVVALALMGALQRNAPLRGPIVMDSPLGRLDTGHTANVIRALPLLAEQVVLLIHESEVGTTHVRDELGNSLSREYKMVRRSARHTVLQKCE